MTSIDPFTPAEVAAFRADDREAAKVIALLVVGIFTIGLVGYLAIACWVAS